MKRLPLSIKLLSLVILVVMFFNMVIVTFSKPDESDEQANTLQVGNDLFKTNCSGCHLNGQNLIRSNKPVIGSSFLKSKKIFKEFLESPPQPMPNFKNIANKTSQLDPLYGYVTSLMAK